ncbi:hypothetical protein EJD96_05545 [Herbaspirillum seropedicae]|uniref:hypothetical protein n=1 Tax=Herbaspirillum seropedicae TaxID=964 RepID=UPI00111D518B|nr:hypothetical protein [Herbaspirillum seropedicae]QDD63648.1 hypothetical protein EJD96_05545 [Herbaspirillum seropedicae]
MNLRHQDWARHRCRAFPALAWTNTDLIRRKLEILEKSHIEKCRPVVLVCCLGAIVCSVEPYSMKKFIKHLVLASSICVFAINAKADAPKRQIENQKLEIFDTGLGVRNGDDLASAGIWLSNDLFAMTSTKDLPAAAEKLLLEVRLVDWQTKTSKILVDEGQLVCWNPERQIASIKTYSNTPGEIAVSYKLIKLTAQGQVSLRSDNVPINQHFCQATASLPPKSLTILLREPDGYIQLNTPGEPYIGEKTAVWMRPGKAPLDMNVRVEEVHGAGNLIGNYLAYSQKYLLNTWDSQGNSDTDRRRAGVGWNRPYDLTPYRLMALDGSIEEIPYPKIIFEYGLKRFAYFLPTPSGALISSNNLYLLQGEKLSRIWPRPGLFGHITPEIIDSLVLSPDGCKIAFRHYRDIKYTTPKSVSIINLCQKA